MSQKISLNMGREDHVNVQQNWEVSEVIMRSISGVYELQLSKFLSVPVFWDIPLLTGEHFIYSL